MLLAVKWGQDSPMSDVCVCGGGAVYSEFQCIMGNGYMGTPMDSLTDTYENITFSQLCYRAVITAYWINVK